MSLQTKIGYQAKDIQRYVKIPKHRYAYLATKIGIEPEVERVDGTGHVNLYSFENLLQFAYAHQASNLGLSPNKVKAMLTFFEKIKDKYKLDIYEEKAAYPIGLHFICEDDFVTDDQTLYFVAIVNITKERQIVPCYIYKGEGERTLVDGKARFGSVKEQLNGATWYVTINLGNIKLDIWKRLGTAKRLADDLVTKPE
jgi:hypothetical protein